MIDFIDPTLKPSAQAEREKVQKNYTIPTLIAIGVICAALIVWLLYVFATARVDTKAQNTINVDERINNTQLEGRIPSIQETR